MSLELLRVSAVRMLKEADLAYQFVPNSYTFGLLQSAFNLRNRLRLLEREQEREGVALGAAAEGFCEAVDVEWE